MSQPKVLIAFYSRSSVTEALAKEIAEGARAAGAEVRIRRAREVVSQEVINSVPGWADQAAALNAKYEAPTEADAEWADAIVFGTPTRFGSVSSELKAYIDSPRWPLVPGQAQRQGRFGVRVIIDAARRQRVDADLAL